MIEKVPWGLSDVLWDPFKVCLVRQRMQWGFCTEFRSRNNSLSCSSGSEDRRWSQKPAELTPMFGLSHFAGLGVTFSYFRHCSFCIYDDKFLQMAKYLVLYHETFQCMRVKCPKGLEPLAFIFLLMGPQSWSFFRARLCCFLEIFQVVFSLLISTCVWCVLLVQWSLARRFCFFT